MRRTVIRIHLWLGITIGLIWALQGLTGSMLVFFREIDRLSGPAASSGPMAPLEAILKSARRATAGAPVVRLSVADGRRDLINALYDEHSAMAHDHGEHLRAVVIDAATARVVGSREDHPTSPFTGSATRWIDMLHMSILDVTGGETLIALSGLVLLSSVLCGLWVGWPPRRGWKAAFSFRRWRTTEQRLYGWHRAAGLVVAAVLICITLSGAYMNLEDGTRAVIGALMPHQAAYRPQPVQALNVRISLEQALRIGQSRFPRAKWVRLTLPTLEEPVYTVRLYQPGESRAWLGKTVVIVDPADGKVLYVYDALTAPWSNRILDAAFPLHNGELLGLPGRIAVMLTGLTLPALYVTGLVRWQRQRKRAALLAAKAARSQPGCIQP